MGQGGEGKRDMLILTRRGGRVVGETRADQQMWQEIRQRRVEDAKVYGFLGVTLFGAGAMCFGEGPIQYVGGAIFVAEMIAPAVYGAARAVKDWRGDDVRARHGRGRNVGRRK